MTVEQSSFQFTNPILLKLDMDINPQYISNDETLIKTDFNVQIHKHKEKRLDTPYQSQQQLQVYLYNNL